MVGGPGVFTMRKMFTGVAEVGGEAPDAVRLHNGAATFASKGCPVGCNFCLVPAMEGRKFTLLPDFEPRPVLCDNNPSALTSDYQDYIVERYTAAGVPLVDANSGFEPQTFDAEVFARWKKINLGPGGVRTTGRPKATTWSWYAGCWLMFLLATSVSTC